MKSPALFMFAVSCVVMPLPAAAQDFISGVHATSRELCDKAREQPDGLQTLFEEGNVVLTHRGIEGIEYNCEFLQVLPATRSPGFVVTALCQEPGYAYPETLVIMQSAEGELELTSSMDVGEDEESGNSGTYYLCEGVEMP